VPAHEPPSGAPEWNPRVLTIWLPCQPAGLDLRAPDGRPSGRIRRGEKFMSGVGGIAGDQLRVFVERIEQIEQDIKGLNEDKREVYAEAKSAGFDIKIMREVISLRRQDQNERDEKETLLAVYLHALEADGRKLEAAE
jgi:uncharacterized protein (UPF0335 family)